MIDVKFTEPAEHDLVMIEHYIHVELCNPISAENLVRGIIERAKSLAKFPKRHPFANDELLRRLGIRLTWFENYNIFYVYDEENNVVNILRVLYDRQDWKNLLIP